MTSRTGVLHPSHQDVQASRAPFAALLMLIGVVVAIVGGLMLAPSVADAQNELVTSEPADGAILAESPEEIVLTFAEPVGNSNNVTISCNGQPFTGLAQPVLSEDSQTLTVEVREPLPSGTCTVVWGVSREDGRPGAEGQFSFAVESGTPGTAPSDVATTTEGGDEAEDTEPEAEADAEPEETTPTTTTAATTTTTDEPDEEADTITEDDDAEVGDIGSNGSGGALWVGRLLSIVGMSVVLGALVLLAIAWPEGPEYVIAVRFIRSAWIVAVVGTVVYVAAAASSATGESFGSNLSPLEWGDLADAGWPGRAALARLVLVLAMGWVVVLPERAVQPSTQLAALGIPVLAVATLGLSRTGGDLPALGVLMGVLHAVAMAVWLGGVIFVSRIVLAGSGGDDLVHATRGFSRLAMPALAVTVVTGLVQLFRLDGGALFSEPHGRVLLLKSLFVAGLLFIAVAAQQVVQARLVRARSMDLRTADRLRRAFGVDAAIGVIVIGLTGWMMTYEPGNVDAEPPEAPDEDTTVELMVENADAGIQLAVEVRPGTVGNNDIAVRVMEPEDGLSALTVTFVPPAGSDQGPVEQTVPLNGQGIAVLAPGDDGLPFEVAGTWTLEVSGSTDTGSISGRQGTFEIRNADGSLPESRIDQGDESDEGGDGEDGDGEDGDGGGENDGGGGGNQGGGDGGQGDGGDG